MVAYVFRPTPCRGQRLNEIKAWYEAQLRRGRDTPRFMGKSGWVGAPKPYNCQNPTVCYLTEIRKAASTKDMLQQTVGAHGSADCPYFVYLVAITYIHHLVPLE